MKSKKYKIGDYVQFEGVYPGDDDENVCWRLINGFIRARLEDGFFEIRTRSGMFYDVPECSIWSKLPILRDKNGRFRRQHVSKKDERDFVESLEKMRIGIEAYKRNIADKDCSCFNCDKCAEQMRAYYEKTGELDDRKPYDEFGSRVKEKKPSERILYALNSSINPADLNYILITEIIACLDEQFEKAK